MQLQATSCSSSVLINDCQNCVATNGSFGSGSPSCMEQDTMLSYLEGCVWPQMQQCPGEQEGGDLQLKYACGCSLSWSQKICPVFKMEFAIKNYRCFQCRIRLMRCVQMVFQIIVDGKYWAIATWQALYLLPSWYPLMHHLPTVFEENKLRCTQEGLFDDEHSILIPLVSLLLRKRTCAYQAFLRNFIEVLCYWRNEANFPVQLHWVVRGKSSLYLY